MFSSLICSASPCWKDSSFLDQRPAICCRKGRFFFTSPEMYRGRPEQLRDLNWKQAVDATGGLLVCASPDGMPLHKLVRGEMAGGDGEPRRQCRPPGVRFNKLNPLTEGQLLHQPHAAAGCLPLEQRFSDGGTYGHLPNQFRLPEGRIDASSAAGLKLDMNNGELMSAREESSVSDPSANGEASLVAPAKKRKASQKGKVKLAEEDNTTTKRCRSMEKKKTETDLVKPNVQQSDNGNCTQNQGKSSNSKSPEPHKDYIHVRARRGQATDSHSLAERVRREKISQRMKLLQDLVPGCNKVTGKAVMLDEIINYVQSLERQVEFLSLKLATVNPQLDFNNMASFVPKDISMACISQPQQGNSIQCVFPNGMETQSAIDMLDTAFHQNLSTHHPFIAGFESASSSQLGTLWEDDLQNVIHMDIGHN